MYRIYHTSNAILFDVIVVYSNDFALKSAHGRVLTSNDNCIYVYEADASCCRTVVSYDAWRCYYTSNVLMVTETVVIVQSTTLKHPFSHYVLWRLTVPSIHSLTFILFIHSLRRHRIYYQSRSMKLRYIILRSIY